MKLEIRSKFNYKIRIIQLVLLFCIAMFLVKASETEKDPKVSTLYSKKGYGKIFDKIKYFK